MGVCAGLADWLKIDVLAVRLATILAVLVAAPVAIFANYRIRSTAARRNPKTVTAQTNLASLTCRTSICSDRRMRHPCVQVQTLGRSSGLRGGRTSEIEALKLGASKEAHYLGLSLCFYAFSSCFDAKSAGKRHNSVNDGQAFTLTSGRSLYKGFINLDLRKESAAEVAK
jgi:phage shock protein PspC (stress-responsive transcriptional regulator)